MADEAHQIWGIWTQMMRKPKTKAPMEFYQTDACCPACKEHHGFWPPMICGHNNLSGRPVWYDRATCSWTIDSPVAAPS